MTEASPATPAALVGETTCDFDYVLTAFRRVQRTRRARVYAVFAILFAALVAYAASREGGLADVSGVLLGAAIALVLVPPVVGRFTARRAFLTSPHKGKTLRFAWSDDGVELATPSSSARLGWAAIIRVVRLPDGLLLFQNAYHATWAPDAMYASPAVAEAVVALARRRAARFVEI